jgi:methylenetetrahydrofolate dehydrogenase (NADP+) / methenyltetrahydrofolate cyclohydrolase
MSGRELAASIRAETAARAAELTAAGRTATLAVVTATADEASAWYVRTLSRTAAKVGIACDVTDLSPASQPESPDAAVESIRVELIALSENPLIHGIVLQTPLPGGARLADLASLIDPAKDVDGANPTSLGRLMTGLPAFAPATAAAVLALLDRYEVALSGRRAVVVGRSAVVGKPVAQLLLARDATVTVCHSRTVDLAAVTSTAEVLVVAAGRAGLVGASFVAAGAVVVDVGTNATADGGLAGDVDPAVAEVAGALSPVPGGVGPVTTALLLRHVVAAATAVPVLPAAPRRACSGRRRSGRPSGRRRGAGRRRWRPRCPGRSAVRRPWPRWPRR